MLLANTASALGTRIWQLADLYDMGPLDPAHVVGFVCVCVCWTFPLLLSSFRLNNNGHDQARLALTCHCRWDGSSAII